MGSNPTGVTSILTNFLKCIIIIIVIKKCRSGEARLKRNRLKICYPRGKHRGFDSRLRHHFKTFTAKLSLKECLLSRVLEVQILPLDIVQSSSKGRATISLKKGLVIALIVTIMYLKLVRKEKLK